MDRLGRRRKAAKTQSAEFASVERNELPMLAILDESLDHMFLVDVLSTQGFMNQKRIEFLERLCSHRRRVTICLAIWSRSDLMFMEELPWGSFIWCASEPRHLIHFDPCRK
ncbi:MAG: BsuBI/PstI family type II restriction endonuclease [Pirellulaceae bacterium]